MVKKEITKKQKAKGIALLFGILLLGLLIYLEPAKKSDGRKKEAAKTEGEKEKNAPEFESPETIRVLLKNSDYSSIYHKEVTVTSDAEMEVKEEEKLYRIPAGEPFSVNISGAEPVEICGGNLSVSTVRRGSLTPSYEGSLFIYPEEEGYVLINQVDFEAYVRGVVPGEMPAAYEKEALKAQAVCARTYGYMKYSGGAMYPEYGAYVDDSVQCQVYKSQQESESTKEAVKETEGKVLTYENGIAATYYFSTSWGYTTGMDAWLKEEVPYLSCVSVKDEENAGVLNFEETFQNPTGAFYESEEPWYRWQLTFEVKEQMKTLSDRILKLQKERPEEVLVWKEEQQNYEEAEPAAMEELKEIAVLRRGSGGVACELELTGEKQKIKVMGQHTIRMLFAPGENEVVRQDGSVVGKMSLLPSGFFLIETEKEGAYISSIKLVGGGFGHGVGMSQNGANRMALLGKGYREILGFFYTGTEIGCLKKE